MSGERKRWNPNIHYHPLILTAVPPGCDRALDVGCGEGMLVRRLAAQARHVTGIDRHAASISWADQQSREGNAEFICDNFLAHEFPASSFDLICSIAALHHMDPAAALVKMSRLLTPGGRLIVIGMTKPELRDLPRDVAATISNLGYKAAKGCWPQPSPIVWPPPHTYREIRALAEATLAGPTLRRLLLWRYLLDWTKPPVP